MLGWLWLDSGRNEMAGLCCACLGWLSLEKIINLGLMETNNPTTFSFICLLKLNIHVGGYNRQIFNLEFWNLTTKVDMFNTVRFWVVQVHRGIVILLLVLI